MRCRDGAGGLLSARDTNDTKSTADDIVTKSRGRMLVPLTIRLWGVRAMEEGRIARLFGLVLAALFTCSLVLNALAF